VRRCFERLTGVIARLAGRRDIEEPLKVQIPSTVATGTAEGISVHNESGRPDLNPSANFPFPSIPVQHAVIGARAGPTTPKHRARDWARRSIRPKRAAERQAQLRRPRQAIVNSEKQHCGRRLLHRLVRRLTSLAHAGGNNASGGSPSAEKTTPDSPRVRANRSSVRNVNPELGKPTSPAARSMQPTCST